jgi:hypothetical protein
MMTMVGLVLIGILNVACVDDSKDAPLVSQALDYLENPVDIPNPDSGRWQSWDTPFGITPEIDHRVPVDSNSVCNHGR